MTEDNPMYLSEDEQKKLEVLEAQLSHPQALAKVLKGERLRRYIAEEARQKMASSQQEAERQRSDREAQQEAERTQRTIDLLRSTNPDTVETSNPKDPASPQE